MGRRLNQLSYSHPTDYYAVVKNNGSLFERQGMTLTKSQAEKLDHGVCTICAIFVLKNDYVGRRKKKKKTMRFLTEMLRVIISA